jgi:hypothetical protein
MSNSLILPIRVMRKDGSARQIPEVKTRWLLL